MTERESGFTLVELLVAIVIIAILAAIAIPVYLQQRQKGYMAQAQAALKNAATAVETYGTEFNGDFSGLHTKVQSDLEPLMLEHGFRVPEWATHFDVVSTATKFCIDIRHESADPGSDWRRATYFSDNGVPTATPDNCPGAPSL